MLRHFLYVTSLFILVGCSSDEKTPLKDDSITENKVKLSQEDIKVSANLLVNQCFSCHLLNATKENRIAPPMAKIKSHYLDLYPDKTDFFNAMTKFVNSPSEQNVVMTKAVSKYGIMPNMQFKKDDVSKIVSYIYNHDMKSDELFALENSSNQPTFEKGDYLGYGRHIVMNTKKQLGKNLKRTIKNKGTKNAVTFCNLNAYPIVDSMSIVFNATITRVSDKNRQPNNKADLTESNYIQSYQRKLDNGGELKPILTETENIATIYMPIVTNEMCLQCHGKISDIDSETIAEIKRLYPNDLAIGYGVNQIRGIWRVEITK